MWWRILASIILLGSVLMAPWYIVLLLMIIFVIMVPYPYEALLYLALYYIWYGLPAETSFIHLLAVTAAALIGFYIFLSIKKRTRARYESRVYYSD